MEREFAIYLKSSEAGWDVGVKGFHLFPPAEEWATDWAAVCAEC